jgi:hypothetical protein
MRESVERREPAVVFGCRQHRHPALSLNGDLPHQSRNAAPRFRTIGRTGTFRFLSVSVNLLTLCAKHLLWSTQEGRISFDTLTGEQEMLIA